MFINNSMRAGSLRFSDTPLLAAGFFIDLNGAHPSTSSGRAEDRAGHGELVEPVERAAVLNRHAHGFSPFHDHGSFPHHVHGFYPFALSFLPPPKPPDILFKVV